MDIFLGPPELSPADNQEDKPKFPLTQCAYQYSQAASQYPTCPKFPPTQYAYQYSPTASQSPTWPKFPPTQLAYQFSPTPPTWPKIPPTQCVQPYCPTASHSPPWREKAEYLRSVPFAVLRSRENRRRPVEIALKYYNKKKGTNYVLVSVLLNKDFLLDGTWFHCNFAAKQYKDGKYSRRIFFAEIQVDVTTYKWNVTACVILEGETIAGCKLCSNVIHPTHGFLKGHGKCEDILPSYSPTSPTDPSKTHLDSSVNTGTFALPSDKEWSNELRRRAEIALEWYNKENGTEYQLVDALNSKGMVHDGFWLHCNFTAKPLNGDISCKLFFAEMLGVRKKGPVEFTWCVTACLILEEGSKTIDGCTLCSEVIHPIQGFRQGNHKSQRTGYPPIVNSAFPETEKQCRRAEIALEYYNNEKGTNYKLIDVVLSNCFLSDGTWHHCNFEAMQNVDGKHSRRFFFAEILSICSPMMETLTVKTCTPLEGGKMTPGCNLCSNVIHPTDGFVKGCHKLESSYSSTSPTYPSGINPISSVKTGTFALPSDEEWSKELLRRATIAVKYYNNINGTDYEVVDALDSKGIVQDGFWLHCNFMAKPLNGDISPKLFFAEMLGVCKNSPKEFTWTVNACLILEGKTTDGCNLCSGIIHPTHGFSRGITSRKTRGLYTPAVVPCTLPSDEKRCRRAEIAIDYYNKENGTNYEFVQVMLSNGFLSDGMWYHCNFEAKQDVEGKLSRRFFFAEIQADITGSFSSIPMKETLTVTACYILEGGKMIPGCNLCSNVIHPPNGFLKGCHKYEA